MARAADPVRIYLVRHGHAAAGWTEDRDPDLDEAGVAQADTMAAELSSLGPLRVVTSPLRRCRRTAAALERVWEVSASTEGRVSEIPSPSGPAGSLDQRGAWLGRVMRSHWDDPDLGAELQGWRHALIAALLGFQQDTVVTTHFVAINVAVGEATGDRRVTSFRPDYCSCTVLDVADGGLRLVERGREGATVVR